MSSLRSASRSRSRSGRRKESSRQAIRQRYVPKLSKVEGIMIAAKVDCMDVNDLSSSSTSEDFRFSPISSV